MNIIGAAIFDGVDFYAMRLIEGQTLAQILFSLRTESRSAGFRFPVTLAAGFANAGTTAEPAAVATTHDSGARKLYEEFRLGISVKQRNTAWSPLLSPNCRLAIQALDGLEHAHPAGCSTSRHQALQFHA